VSPTNGTLAFNNNGSFTYLPFSNYFGPDSFVYQVSDGTNLSNPATVALSVTVGANTPPVANNDSYRVIAGTPGTINVIEGVLSNDTDAENDPRTAVLATTTANGALSLNPDGSFVYTPNSGFTVGIDTFTYRVSDGIATSDLATVAISVGSNTPPTAFSDTYQIPVGGRSVSAIDGVRNNDIDPDGDALTTVSLVANPTNGVLNLNSDGSFNYTPNATFTSGVDTFTYRVSDGLAASNIATVTLSVSPNAVPIARDDAYRAARGTVNVGGLNGVLQNDTDADGSSLTATVVSAPTNGVLTLNQNGSFSYQANPAFTQGVDTFTYRVSDGIATSNLATVTLSVAPNSAPVAVNDSYTVTGASLVVPGPGILVNDVDAEGDPLEIRLTRLTSGGSLFVISDRTRPDYGSFRYSPFPGFRGTDFFVYELSDGISSSNSATVNLTVG
ncbi:tandem-95 repeat protein, partial [Leptolyngbya sp. FACHB-36]|uniref:Ig-like domain-containing protein n=1 Tax=Leptolyngbya sp. FACHB-36 TaxID=2692808 RepID=UPI001680B302